MRDEETIKFFWKQRYKEKDKSKQNENKQKTTIKPNKQNSQANKIINKATN